MPEEAPCCARRFVRRGLAEFEKKEFMTDKKDQPTFEEALSELEAIVDKMEQGTLPLEESVKAFARGTELVRMCTRKLQAAEGQIKKLEADGSLADFEVKGMSEGEQS